MLKNTQKMTSSGRVIREVSPAKITVRNAASQVHGGLEGWGAPDTGNLTNGTGGADRASVGRTNSYTEAHKRSVALKLLCSVLRGSQLGGETDKEVKKGGG